MERAEGEEVAFEGLAFTEPESPSYRFKARTILYEPVPLYNPVPAERYLLGKKYFLRLTVIASNQAPLSMDLSVDWGVFGVWGD